jgi:hypothetical protein
MVGIDLNNIDKKEIIKFGANISFDEIGCARKATTLAHLFNIIDNRIKKERKESLVEGLVIHYLNESGLTTYPYLIFPKPRLAIFGPQQIFFLTIPIGLQSLVLSFWTSRLKIPKVRLQVFVIK